MGPLGMIQDGACQLGEMPGIGVEPDLRALDAIAVPRK